MKTIVTSLVGLLFAAGLVGHADAATYKKKKRLQASYPRAYSYRSEDDSIGGYYERRLEAVRFGSQRWWYIYDSQQGGRRR